MVKDVHHLGSLRVCLLDSENGGVFVEKVEQSYVSAKVKDKKVLDPILIRIKGDVGRHKVMAFEVCNGGTMWYQGGLCILCVDGL